MARKALSPHLPPLVRSAITKYYQGEEVLQMGGGSWRFDAAWLDGCDKGVTRTSHIRVGHLKDGSPPPCAGFVGCGRLAARTHSVITPTQRDLGRNAHHATTSGCRWRRTCGRPPESHVQKSTGAREPIPHARILVLTGQHEDGSPPCIGESLEGLRANLCMLEVILEPGCQQHHAEDHDPPPCALEPTPG